MIAALLLAAAILTDHAGDRWCVTLASPAIAGPGGVPFAWVSVDADPRRVFFVPVSTLDFSMSTTCLK